METNPGITVPLDAISEDALVALVEAFILMEGTDYGAQEISLKTKTAQVIKQLQSGDVVIVYDPTEDSCSLRRKEDLKWPPSTSSLK